MNNTTLPTDELKKYGIINEDNSFSKKLNTEDVQKFLQGYTIVADNDKNRATFQLTDNNTKLKVIFLKRDKNLPEILKNSRERVEYIDIQKVSNKLSPEFSALEKKAFIFDKETSKIVEFDFIKNATELTAIIADKKDTEELNRYKNELLKLKNYLLDKIVQYPEIAREITNDLSIVSREINIIGSNFTLNSIFHSNPDLVIRDTFNNPTELVRFIEKQQLANKQLILQNNRESTEITISNESIKQKFLSDLWAQELEKKTDLSSGLTYTQIDEKQAHHYRNYEVEAAKLSLEGSHQIEMTDVEENADFFSDEGFEENLTPASDLPDGWTWNDYDDGSGSLKSPSGHRYYSYDMLTQEYRLPYGRREWTGMRDFYDAPKSLNEFKSYVENDLKAKVVQNNLYPKLSEEEKNDILNYRIFMKENEFILENLQITANQKKLIQKKWNSEQQMEIILLQRHKWTQSQMLLMVIRCQKMTNTNWLSAYWKNSFMGNPTNYWIAVKF